MPDRLSMVRRAGIGSALLLAFAAALASSIPASAIPPASDPGVAVRIHRVLVMGDSIQIGVGPVIKTAFHNIPVDVVAEGGQTSLWGLGVLPTVIRPDHDVVVFDMGTNDDASYYDLFEGRLEDVIDIVGPDRCLVIATITHPAFFGSTVAGMNSVIRRIAESSPHIQLVNWREMVLRDPGLLYPDAIHPTPEGSRIRAGMIVDAIASCPPDTHAEPISNVPAPGAPEPAPAEPPRPEPEPRARPTEALGAVVSRVAFFAHAQLGLLRARLEPRRHPPQPLLPEGQPLPSSND
jgi:lysophospholipase L1-like esterase